MNLCAPLTTAYLSAGLQGLRAGGGIGDVMAFQGDAVPTYTARLFFDLTFFVIVTVILMNVIFGEYPSHCARCPFVDIHP
jgi:hypothetical protein